MSNQHPQTNPIYCGRKVLPTTNAINLLTLFSMFRNISVGNLECNVYRICLDDKFGEMPDSKSIYEERSSKSLAFLALGNHTL